MKTRRETLLYDVIFTLKIRENFEENQNKNPYQLA